MKIFTTISILFIVFTTLGLHAQTNQDYTVQAHAVVTTTPPSISIYWPKISTGVTGYTIYRKAKNEQSWGGIKGITSGTETMWTDTDVIAGKLYEYNIQKMNGSTLLGITYLLSGIEIPAVHQRGTALVVVEKALADSIANELPAYLLDIASDGWNVFTTQVAKTETVKFVKSEIQRFDSIAGGLTSVILLGHVPVPYSGNFGKDTNFKIGAPDGHVEHSGCWPADVYYAIDNDQWTDTATNTNGVRSENKNLPGDGKFDNTSLPAPVKYQLGRIDLSNMPIFPLSEAELTKQYFKKAHDFRNKITQTAEKGVINDQFGASNGANGSQAWRDFSVLFGTKNIIEYDYLTSCSTENILFAFGAGGGTYTNCGRVCATDSFLTRKPAVFNMLFGSNFGDWDNVNNLLRAPLAASQNGLTNAWSSRPHWQHHAMAMGFTIGDCAMTTQNNKNVYTYNYAANAVHVALMGDPTLRLHIIAPPTNTIATATNSSKVDIRWNASVDPTVLGYYLYRSDTPLGHFTLLNSTPQSQLTYTDNSPLPGTNYYQIKAVTLTTSPSGSYYNTSIGATTSAAGSTSVEVENIRENPEFLHVSPLPSHDYLRVQFSRTVHEKDIELLTIDGKIVRTIRRTSNASDTSDVIDIRSLSSGMYIVKIGNVSCRFIKE